MTIACGTICFTQSSFDRACAEIAQLGFKHVDLAVMEGWAHFDATKLLADFDKNVKSAEDSLSKFGLTPVAFNASAGTSEVGAETERFGAICRFANALNVSVICYGAPVAAVGMERAARRYERLRDIAFEHGMILAVEAHARTMLEMPDMAVEFCETIEGIFLTFDPSHMVAGPNQSEPFDQIYPYVRHTHWRDSGNTWERCQLPVGEGLVDFESMLGALKAVGYSGTYSVEYIDTFPNAGRRHIAEMKRTLESYL
ncbi:MAG: sugar phosphate isomerase/epimerase [Candidatus Poribacteria bacterium]|nr:sugar phosphate isomerase/epimerase [Candidatus Poribacteria bacterium]